MLLCHVSAASAALCQRVCTAAVLPLTERPAAAVLCCGLSSDWGVELEKDVEDEELLTPELQPTEMGWWPRA